ncbi:sigma-70 family RNA polymerase sigma factor [Halobacillus trueperi]|uniref:RNA polymerase factor sigma C n=1 Tax=Halobacillus trueperi TaxID=156205 RepID=A0A3E0IYF7_9BACI|nr:sigma-70 family RNA polymerase sigma factor [Halobacillus trueperi]REJ05632.1 RNA polymerase factor sigma C [Halobacillus trueperi]
MNEVTMKNKDVTYNSKEYALDELMDSHSKKVYLLAYSYVKDQGTAEDITQDVFIKLYNNLSSFRGEASISSWIYRITVNRAKDILRRRKLAHLKYPLKYFEQENHTESTEEAYLKESRKEQVLTAILSLPVKYREVLILHYFHDQSIESIRKTINEKENTIKTRLSRGREKLKSNPLLRKELL